MPTVSFSEYVAELIANADREELLALAKAREAAIKNQENR